MRRCGWTFWALLTALVLPGNAQAAPMSCPASLEMATGNVSIPSDWLMLPNFFPPNPLALPLYSTSFDTDGEFQCLYQAGAKLLGIWQKIPPTCSTGAGTWYGSQRTNMSGWTCYGPAQNCTFTC
jgi:hypothetical protein